jgi:hypothetical protein
MLVRRAYVRGANCTAIVGESSYAADKFPATAYIWGRGVTDVGILPPNCSGNVMEGGMQQSTRRLPLIVFVTADDKQSFGARSRNVLEPDRTHTFTVLR